MEVSDLTNQKFGRLVAIEFERRIRHYKGNRRVKIYWKCICDCGDICYVESSQLKQGKTKSCGCYNIECVKKRSTTHGMSNKSEYRIYKEIKKRCRNKNDQAYKDYGGRGIKLLFDDFEVFYNEVGPRPSNKHTIDRYPNNNGNYESGNIKWSTREEQAQNRRSTQLNPQKVRFIRENIGIPNRILADKFGVSKSTIKFVKSGRTWKNIL